MPAQSAALAQLAPSPLNVRQYGCGSQVAHVYAEPQSASLVQVLVQVAALLPAVEGAQYEYIALAHVAAAQLSPRPTTGSQTPTPFLVDPEAHPHAPATTTSSGAQGVHPSPLTLTIALLSQRHALSDASKVMAGPHGALGS